MLCSRNAVSSALLAQLLLMMLGRQCHALSNAEPSRPGTTTTTSRRGALGWMAGAASAALASGTMSDQSAHALAEGKIPDSFDVDEFLRTGIVAQPMGVSGQAGKSRPETGIFLRDGSEVNRDPRSGDVLAEILLRSTSSDDDISPVLASFTSPWPLATGTVFDVECRDANTGDSAFLAATGVANGKGVSDLKDSFFLDSLFDRTGRFSMYGQPTDIKVKKSSVLDGGRYRDIEVTFSTLSQSTQTEIPRRARMIATIPDGTDQAVMLVGSASALRWNKGSEKQIENVIKSFRAIPAPQSSLRMRAKERRTG